MTLTRCALMLTTAGVLAAQPCAAAADTAAWDEPRLPAFAGLSIRMPLGNTKAALPSARLQLTTSYHLRDDRTGSVQTLKANGLEIGASARGTPSLYLNGQSTAEIKEKVRLSGSSDTATIVLGVALVVVGVLVIANLNTLSD